MSDILSRKFIAVNCQGKPFFILDIAQLIRDYGFSYFLTEFGFNHGAIKRQQHVAYITDVVLPSGDTVRSPVYETVMVSERHYILTDNQGKRYSPDYILSVFDEAFPAEAKVMWKKLQPKRYGMDTSGRNGLKKYAYYYFSGRKKGLSGRRLKQQDAILKEMGTDGVRDLNEYHDCPYDNGFCRGAAKSWKHYRKTQYRS